MNQEPIDSDAALATGKRNGRARANDTAIEAAKSAAHNGNGRRAKDAAAGTKAPSRSGHKPDEIELLREQIASQGEQLSALLDAVRTLAGRQADLTDLLAEVHEDLNDQSDAEQAAFDRLHESLGAEVPGDWSYRGVLRQVRRLVRQALPAGAQVAVVSKGDERLLQLPGCEGSHFPRLDDGTYMGFHPACSTAAIGHLEVVRSQGAEFLLLPETALWWLESYPEFGEHLRRRYTLIVDEPACRVYDLRSVVRTALTQLEEVFERFESEWGGTPAVLDWDSGLGLVAAFPTYPAFSPPEGSAALPYLGGTVDVVVLSAGDAAAVEEATRVARAAVVIVGEAGDALDVRWKDAPDAGRKLSVSIVMPAYNGIDLTEASLKSLFETLPAGFEGEVIVVNDASTDDSVERLAALAERYPLLRVLRNERNAGFIRTVNRGAAAATGDIIILLNNDTVLLPGWLPPILRVFREHADAGAVGVRLLFGDGSLQEGGAVVFRDGSAANLGRNDFDCDAPLYSFLREVDYCSGAVLATPRSLWELVGGLDVAYAPAYYDDVDYCFRVRDRGYRVFYQPKSVVAHLEGSTHGTDTGSGVKRYQVVNRETFEKRWRKELAAHPVRPAEFNARVWHQLARRPGAAAKDEVA